MGYKSDVAILLYGEQLTVHTFFNSWKEKWKGNAEDKYGEIDHATSEDVMTEGAEPDGSVWYKFLFDGIKWYSDTIFARAFEDMCESCSDLDNIVVEFARIGEDTDDTVHEWHGDEEVIQYHLGIERTISCDI